MGQEFRNGLAECFWHGVSHEVTVKSAGVAVIWGCLHLEDLFFTKLIHMAGKFLLATGRKYLIPVIRTSVMNYLSVLTIWLLASPEGRIQERARWKLLYLLWKVISGYSYSILLVTQVTPTCYGEGQYKGGEDDWGHLGSQLLHNLRQSVGEAASAAFRDCIQYVCSI